MDKFCLAINNKKLVIAPSESVYGVFADATCNDSLKKLKIYKQRSCHKPFGVVVGDLEILNQFFYVSSLEQKLINNFWPGPLNLLLKPKKEKFAEGLNGNSKRFSVRIPDCKFLIDSLKSLKKPVLSPSANFQNEFPIYLDSQLQIVTSDEIIVIKQDPDEKYLYESTLLLAEEELKILRSGPVTYLQLSNFLNKKIVNFPIDKYFQESNTEVIINVSNKNSFEFSDNKLVINISSLNRESVIWFNEEIFNYNFKLKSVDEYFISKNNYLFNPALCPLYERIIRRIEEQSYE